MGGSAISLRQPASFIAGTTIQEPQQMFLFYVDESGDSGLPPASSTTHYALSALVVHELRWTTMLDALISFRREARKVYGIKLKEEIHASPMIVKPGDLARIPRSLRLRLLRDVLDFQAAHTDLSVVNVVVDKTTKPSGYDVFEVAWKCLLQRLNDTLEHRNFPGPHNAQEAGLLVVDDSEEKKLRSLMRKLRRYNPIPSKFEGGASRNRVIRTFVEDPVHRNSAHSYFVQCADVNAYFLYQLFRPNGYIRRAGARNYLNRLDPILCKVASAKRNDGIVLI